jgi:hypothetical protein
MKPRRTSYSSAARERFLALRCRRAAFAFYSRNAARLLENEVTAGEVSARGATYREGAVLLWGESKRSAAIFLRSAPFAPDAFLDRTT